VEGAAPVINEDYNFTGGKSKAECLENLREKIDGIGGE
jgi:hypothetical protein